ncbi:two-component system sensor histidine kinase EvgS [Vibrio crassostreae]|uniref:ATP-binding protein n=1 Tax=Vibrio crassostreae TaxID=246167 RepID=UPI00119BD969|nr:ATP-binding protein [Vibrio crassostreae]TWD40957.1 two-component system sensor histidine kinase EvgS [Vibrio crassostreae]
MPGRILLTIFSFLIMFVSSESYSSGKHSSNGDKEGIVAGILIDSEGQFFSHNAQIPESLQLEILGLLNDWLDLNFSYKEFSDIQTIKQALDNNEINMIAGFEYNNYWSTEVVHSLPLFEEPYVGFVTNGATPPNAFSEIKWGCIKGSKTCQQLQLLEYSQVIQVDSRKFLYEGVEKGEIDAIIDNKTNIHRFVQTLNFSSGRIFYFSAFGLFQPSIIANSDFYPYISIINKKIKEDRSTKRNYIKSILSHYGFNIYEYDDFFADAKKTKIIKYTVEENVFPYSYFDEKRQLYSGFVHDALDRISLETPLEFVYVPPNGRSVENMLIENEVDLLPLVNSGLTEGENFLHTKSYTNAKFVQVEYDSDFKYKKLAVLDRLNILPLEFFGNNIRIYKNLKEMMSDLDSGDITNAYVNSYVTSSLMKISGDIKNHLNIIHNASELKVDLAMAVSKENQKLLLLMDSALKLLSEREIENIWLRYNDATLTWNEEEYNFSEKIIYLLCASFTFLIILFWVIYRRLNRRVEKTQSDIFDVKVKNLWLDRTINNLPSLICVFDNKGDVILTNKIFRDFQLEAEFVSPKELLSSIFQSKEKRWDSEFECTIDTVGDNYSFSGSSFEIVNSKIFDKETGEINYVLVITDITTSKSRENHLIATNQKVIRSIAAQQQFLAVISHELRTPISAMLGLMEILDSRISIYEDKLILENAVDSAKRLKLLVNDILDFSKLDANQVTILNEDCNLAKILGGVIRGFEASCKLKNVEFYLDWPPSQFIEAKIDSIRLSQILSNILSNAVKFTQKGFITVAVEVSESALRLAVRDTGIGMTKAQQSTIFEPFVQAEASISRHFGGTGLGMSIVANLVRLMKGHITVQSEFNLGTLVEVTLPIKTRGYDINVSNQVEVHSRQEKEWLDLLGVPCLLVAGPSTSGNLYPDELFYRVLGGEFNDNLQDKLSFISLSGTVLVVDDDLINRFLIEKQLSEFGLIVSIASDGDEALTLLKDTDTQYDLIITDCHMPSMDGFTLTLYIRNADNAYKNIPVVACTADNSTEIEIKSKDAGINEIIYKPYDLGQLHRVVSHFLPSKGFEPELIKEATKVEVIDALESFDWLDKFTGTQKEEMAYIVIESLNHGIKDLNDNEIDTKEVAHKIKGAAGALSIEKLFNLANQLELTPNDDELKSLVTNSVKLTISEAKAYLDSIKEK